MNPFRHNGRARAVPRILATLAGILLAAPSRAAVPAAPIGRVLFSDSVKDVPLGEPVTRPHRVREVLRPDETAQEMDIAVSLRMRDLAGLEARLHAGQKVSKAEMEARYLPSIEDYARVSDWLVSQGLTLTQRDPSHTNVFARGPVSRVSSAFAVRFARVATADGEFTSAVTAPSMPADVAPAVLAIVGLQPHIRMHAPKPRTETVTNVSGFATPSDVQAAYNVPGTLDGTGQTIAIIMDATPNTSDLTTFWTMAGITRPGSATYTVVNISGGSSGINQTSDLPEVTMDTEWSTGMAPGASLRVYAMPDLGYNHLLAACTQIVTDGIASVASYSAGGDEEGSGPGTFMSNSQEFAIMESAGITMLASSGDGGSNPDTTDNGYTSTNMLSAEYPASDPNVTGVGGTTISFDPTSWVYTGEVVWNSINSGTGKGNATGGGISTVFSKPSWQTGTAVPAGSWRLVPDVAAMSIGNGTSAFIYLNGATTSLGGTSLASPIWAGLTAVINQARANLGHVPIGPLNPTLYPLGTSAYFNEITSGNNGAYTAATGYNLCTGLGTPNLGNIINQIAHQTPVGDTAIGTQALGAITYGANNTASGYQALYADSSGNNNVGVGSLALKNNTSGNQNVAIGFQSLWQNTTGIDLTAVGYNSLPNNTTGAGNSAFGYNSLAANTTGNQNEANGTGALAQNTTGSFDTANGYKAVNKNTTGADNTGTGFQSLFSDTAGTDNTASGYEALDLNTGSRSTAVGSEALAADSTGTDADDTAVGFKALAANNGSGGAETAVGFETLYNNTTALYQTALGMQALTTSSTGGYNMATGCQAGYHVTTGEENVAVGYNALVNIMDAYVNIGIGEQAGVSLGVSNNYNVDIGNPGGGTDSGVIRIGTSQSSAFIAGIGGAAVTGGIPVYVVAGTGQLGVETSSQRFKADIEPMGSVSDVLLSLRPVTFRYAETIDPAGIAQFGLVAEEVERLSPDLVVYGAGHEVYSVRYEAVNAMLLNEFRKEHARVEELGTAIAELGRQADAEEREVASHRQEIASIKAALAGSGARQRAIEALRARLGALDSAAATR